MYSGRLELTWTNKHERLLAHEDGSYQWVPRGDYRVSEVRLLRDAGTSGRTNDEAQRVRDNLLVRGDALHALTSLSSLSEFADEYVGGVKLAYLDPPFNTQQAFGDFDDALEHSVWLTMMRDRLHQLRKLLAADGSVWVHCDDYEQHRLRCVLDEVFGAANFITTVVWEKADSPRMDADHFSSRHDYLHVYALDRRNYRTRHFAYDSGTAAHYNKEDAAGRRYYLKPLRAMGGQGETREARPTLYYPLIAPDGTEVFPKLSNGADGAWRWKLEKTVSEADRIEWVNGAKGWSPYFRIYAKEAASRPPETIWPATEVGSNRTSKAEVKKLFPGQKAFATPKPEGLMARIIAVASDPGDIVLDCFAGSGTTAAVAQKTGRRWVTVEWSKEIVEAYAGPRLEKVIAGSDPNGVTQEMGWEGGGGFRVLDVAPSMFEEDEGQVVLADWALGTALSEATAAQLGFEYDTRLPPFCGRKGRMRLAVVDGLVNEAVARLLMAQLPQNEKLTLCGTMLDPIARDVARKLRPGSGLRKIPESILAEYRRSQLWWDRHDGQLESGLAAGQDAVEVDTAVG